MIDPVNQFMYCFAAPEPFASLGKGAAPAVAPAGQPAPLRTSANVGPTLDRMPTCVVYDNSPRVDTGTVVPKPSGAIQAWLENSPFSPTIPRDHNPAYLKLARMYGGRL